MKETQFIHLHNHSEYSLLDGLIKITDNKGRPSDFLKHLSVGKVPALAITDHGNMYGAVDFYFTCIKLGIKPIIGCEVYLSPDNRKDKSAKKASGHMTLLAKDFTGYRNLMALVSDAHTEGFYYEPRTDTETLSKYSKGIIALSGCLKSFVSQACLNRDIDASCKLAGQYGDIFGKENFYIELMDHALADEQKAMTGLIETAKRTGLGIVATNDCHYPRKEDWQAQDINICIRTGCTLDDPNRLKILTKELYFKSPQEMIKLFSDVPEAIVNTVKIAQMCNLEIPHDKFILPHFELKNSQLTLDDYLKKQCVLGLEKKLKQIPEEYEKRLDFELSVINKMQFPAYFLIVADFINYARSQNIPVGPGRGSGAGSLVSWALDITRIDPIKNGLLFERFLNPDRLTMPDLDIDFSDDGRAKVIEYVKNKYGQNNVAQIITFGTIKAKLAIRDTARVMGFTPTEANQIARLVPFSPDATIYHCLKTVPELKELGEEPRIKNLLDNAQKIEGLKRHTGVHAAGIVVTRDDVTGYTPLARSSRDVFTTQYEGETLVKLGLLKIDFLGLRTLTVINTAIELIKKTKNKIVDIENIPPDDEKTYKLLQTGKTLGIFQLESRGMRDLVRALEPSQFSDISALVALYRPGPMQSGMLNLFVERKHGRKKVTYEHSMLEPILKETYGTLVYQEQVIEIAKKLGGFTPGKADNLRKAMGKKLTDVMENAEEDFLKGCKQNGISPRIAKKIFEQMAQFAGYGFNKSHSVAYALIAYQTAYLKANYPVEFMTALLISEIGKSAIGSEDRENKIVTYLEQARNIGIEILPPDVNKSGPDFTIENWHSKKAIRFGLRAIKNVGEQASVSISEEARKSKGFKSLQDLCSKADMRQVNKKTLESLAKAGALDSLYPDEKPEFSRSKILDNLENVLSAASELKQEIESGQGSLFAQDMQSLNSFDNKKTIISQPLAEHTMLNYEKEVLGFYFSGHPLARYADQIRMLSPVTIEQIHSQKKSFGTIKVAGIIEVLKKKTSKQRQPWASFELEDITSSIQVNVFPKNYARLAGNLKTNTIVVVKGKINHRTEAGEAEIFAEDVLPLETVFEKFTDCLMLKFPAEIAEEKLKELNKLLARHTGKTPVYLHLEQKSAKPVLVKTKKTISLNSELFNETEKLLGKSSFEIKMKL